MNILAFDTCFGACSVALIWSEGARGGAPPAGSAYRFERMDRGHAERLIPMIDEAMREAPIGFSVIDRIAVTVGPGTFTGVRIGVAAARALSLATGIKVAGTSSLHLLASQVRARMAAESRSVIRGEAAPMPGVPPKDVVIAVEARRDEIYFQLFGDEENRPLTEPLLMSPGRAAALLRSGDTIVAGSGAPRLCEAARKIDLTLSPVLVDEEPDARFLARMTGLQILVPPLPLYLRPPDATPQNGKTLARAI